jgi:hypothetical protein
MNGTWPSISTTSRRFPGGTATSRAASTGIQGWKKAKIYPDLIFAVQSAGAAKKITVLETKGDQLDNLDTAYKRDVLAFLSDHFAWDESVPAGELELVQNNGETVHGTLILMSEWKAKLPDHLTP